MSFTIGYSLPFSGVMIGLGFGFERLTAVVEKLGPIVRIAAGVLQIAVGFSLLIG